MDPAVKVDSAIKKHLKQPHMRPSRAEEMQRWKEHVANDGETGLQGRGRPRQADYAPRSVHVSGGSLAEGLDQRGKVAYFLVGVYTYPVDTTGRSLVRKEEERPLPAKGDLLEEVDGELEPMEE